MKQIIYLVAFCLMLLSACKIKNDGGGANARPNIVFILSDDHASQAISAYGGIYDSLAPTPNIDRLADEGMMMRNVFCTNAICGPSRATILTGKYSHINGYYKNESGGQFNANQWTFPEELQKNGYQTALFGKWHLGSEPRGFDFFKYHEGAGQQGYYWNPVYNENGVSVTEKGYATNLTTDFALEWLDQAIKKDQPICMLLQYKAPHRSWEPDTKYVDLWKDISMPYPDTYNDNYRTREKTAGDTEMEMNDFSRNDMKLSPPENLKGKELSSWYGFGNQRDENVYPDKSLSPEENRNWKFQTYIKDYLACIKSVDDNVGRVVDYLDKNGLAENTIVIYTSDQGFYLGEHGWFDKRFMYEESLRMPFLVRYPAKIEAGTANKDIITNIDFAPTLLEVAGITPPEEIQGRSFFANLQGNTPDDWTKSMYYHYYEFPFWHHVQPHYGIRNERYKLIHFYYNIDIWEFYDLEKDPNELNNAINEPVYIDIIKDMKIDLAKQMEYYGNNKSLDDLRAITNTDFGKISEIEKK
ncbi:sulfatase family protein [Draconibacterium mangrovi]|uniref:sulfatase family protein n=1 Tax=Draconibacterium mangrovi TaxID=2697469 RepID=UPI00195444D7|nr:sulfatase [Draconibacterium mangrovi]